MPLARFDTWVRSAVGPAAAGTQVYICTQPAITNAIPPSPRASLFSDAGASVPIAQPLVADGFGHAYAYVASGTYTVVLVNNGIIQQVYPDQLIGQGAGTSLTLQTNGVPNTLQSLLNIQGAGSVSVSSDGVGGVTITGSTANPAGSTGQVQYNNSGVLGASAQLLWDLANNNLHIGNTPGLAGVNSAIWVNQTLTDGNEYDAVTINVTNNNASSGPDVTGLTINLNGNEAADGSQYTAFGYNINLGSATNSPNGVVGGQKSINISATSLPGSLTGEILSIVVSGGNLTADCIGDQIIATIAGTAPLVKTYDSRIQSSNDYISVISDAVGFSSSILTHGGDVTTGKSFLAQYTLGRGNSTNLYGLYVATPTQEALISITHVSITGNVVTLTVVSNGVVQVGDHVVCTGLSGASFLNSQPLIVTSANITQVVANFTHGNYTAADSGNLQFTGTVAHIYGLYVNTQSASIQTTDPWGVYVVSDKSFFGGSVRLNGTLLDGANDAGVTGKVLESIGTGVRWAAPSALLPTSSYMIGPGYTTFPAGTSTALSVSTDPTSLVLDVYLFTMLTTLSFDKIRLGYAAGAGGIFYSVAIYSGPNSAVPGTLVWSSGALTIPWTTAIGEFSVPAFTLTPGEYYLAHAANTGLGGLSVVGIDCHILAQGAGTATILIPSTLPIAGVAANPCTTSGGTTLIVPATLGAISAYPDSNGRGFPMCTFFHS